jgi:hypothetical protein
MKRSLILFFIVFVTACETPPIDLRDEIVTAMAANDSFVVLEDFRWQQFARKGDSPYNVDVISTNRISFVQNRYLTEHFFDEQLYQEGVSERSLLQVSTYKDIFNQQAAIRFERDWLGIQLPQINQIGLGTIDPQDLISQLLYQSSDLYYKSDEGITGSFDDYRYVVVTVNKDLFETLFVHTITPYLDFPYDYRVFIELEFNEAYLIESITFDFSNLISQYKDYFEVQQGVRFTSLDVSYTLTYSQYGEMLNNPPIISSRLFIDGQVVINPTNAIPRSNFVDLRSVRDSDLVARINTLVFRAIPTKPLRLLVVELVQEEGDDLTLLHEQLWLDVSTSALDYFEQELPTTDQTYYVVIRGITRDQGRYFSEIIRLNYTQDN